MIDQTISHYKILSKLGGGGMGVVYKAEDTKLHRSVALKFLPPELTFDSEAKERFIHEARAASALDHPNICSIYEINETPDGQSYIAMGCYEGETLKQKLGRGKVSQEEAIPIALQIGEGLARAHDARIVHRDIKPANIMITERGEVKILDFGLAKLGGMTRVTKTGTTVGTAAYMSPEQARGEEVDQRSDIWSFGVVLYEMLAGELPFKSEYEQGLIYLILNDNPEPLTKHVPGISPDLVRIVNRAMNKKPDSRYTSAAEMVTDLKAYRESLSPEVLAAFSMKRVMRKMRRPMIAIPTIAAITALVISSYWYADRQGKMRWAREVALPEIEEQIAANDFWRNLIPPYKLAVQAEQYVPDDPKLKELLTKCSLPINVRTEPPGATVYWRDNSSPGSEWEYGGVTPLENYRVPIAVLQWKIHKDGYDTVLAAMSTWDYNLQPNYSIPVPYDLVRALDKTGSIPADMVRVRGNKTAVGQIGDFYLDKYEVTNRQYKQFIDSGGYRNRKYWEYEFVDAGKKLSWEEGIKECVDQTGLPGPSTWQGGYYPEGQDGYPVAGVSWYEAAAYAKFAGRRLPTIYHWGAAEGDNTPYKLFDNYTRFCNFNGKGIAPVGTFIGMTPYGNFDMGGNVREWCSNETETGRSIRGGAWNDNAYMACVWSQTPAMDRSERNGIRCALYLEPEKITESVFQPVKDIQQPDFYKQQPVPDAIFDVYKEQFVYDKTPLNARVESRSENPEGWIWERVTFDATYGGERIIANLFLPKRARPPYQTVIYVPGAGSLAQNSSKEIESYYEFPMFLSFLLKNGRAVLYPVYKGTFERSDPTILNMIGESSRRYTDFLVQFMRDFSRCVDYLDTRTEIDTGRLAYYGLSWGGHLGAMIPAVETRLKASVLLGGGLTGWGRPEVNAVNYVGRVKVPTLMMGGKYDVQNPPETRQKPMYDLLGTRLQDKQIKFYETDHFIPRNEYIKETQAWLDRYLGPVK
jgi:eukaryotic-like serine/threonine-protein kinase